MDREPDSHGYSTALSAPAPVPLPWELFLRFRWWFGDPKRWFAFLPRSIGRILARFGLSSTAKLTELSFINAARWSLFHRVPPSHEWWRRKGMLPRSYLLFEANFNGDTDQYLEAFSLVVAGGMRNFWGAKHGLAGAYDVPDVAKVTKFLSYVGHRKTLPSYHYCGYPEASTKMVRCALELEHRIGDFRKRTMGKGPKEIDEAWRELSREAQYIRNPPARTKRSRNASGDETYLTAVAAVLPDRNADLRADLQTLDQGPTPVPADVTHFARWVLIDSLYLPRKLKGKRQPTSYLTFSAWFDGSREEFVEKLHLSLGARASGIWRHCGYEGGDAAALLQFLVRHEVRGGAPAVAYDGVTVKEVRRALHTWEDFTRVMVEAQRLEGEALQKKLIERGILRP